MTVFALDKAVSDGAQSWVAEWSVSGSASGPAKTQGPLQPAAIALAPETIALSSVKTDSAKTTNTEAETIELFPVTLTLEHESKVLVAFQSSSMHVSGNGAGGAVTIRVDEEPVAWAHVQSQNNNWSAPTAMVAAVTLPAGEHTIDVAWPAVHSYNVHLDEGLSRLTAVVLE